MTTSTGVPANSEVVWLYEVITVLGYALALVPLALFLRDVKRFGRNVFSASKTFMLNVVLFLLPAIAFGVMILFVLGVLGAVDASLEALEPANAIMALVVVLLAYRKTRRTMQISASDVEAP